MKNIKIIQSHPFRHLPIHNYFNWRQADGTLSQPINHDNVHVYTVQQIKNY